MGALNHWDEEPSAPKVTLPPLKLLPIDDTAERAELAARLAEQRTVRRGRDAWEQINKAESFDGWKAIGAALAIGRDYALRSTGANAPMGRPYSWAFSAWAKQHGFAGMQKSVRSVALELHEHIDAITAWRATLPERQRRRLVHPLSNVRRWRAATMHNGKGPQDLKRDAVAAWRRFVFCVQALPADQAAPLWRAVSDAMAGDQ